MKLCNLFSFWISSAQPQGLWSQDFIFCTADPNDGSLLGLRLRAGLCYSCLCIYRTESSPTERITSPQSSSCVAVDSAFSQAPTITYTHLFRIIVDRGEEDAEEIAGSDYRSDLKIHAG